jgi:hypothetical protein
MPGVIFLPLVTLVCLLSARMQDPP